MATDQGVILVVDDDEDILTAAKLLLKRHYLRIDTCPNPALLPELMANTEYAAILLDMNFGPGEFTGEQGFYWLGEILKIDPDAVVVLITAHAGLDVAVEAMKIGATDFIAKPWQNEKMIATLSASVKLRQTRLEAQQLKQTNRTLVEVASTPKQPMLGASEAMASVMSMIERAAPTVANVLILGENGTGKELVARAIHKQSNRRDKVFMSVDLGAITESLFESELFGHKKGAFTDARQDRIGKMQAADGGTLFLDEIGNLPLHLQAKLLSVLEQRQVSPVGASKTVPVDIRVITATNLPKHKLNDESYFRQDLLFRLNTVEIDLPPLRDRKEDIVEIATYYADFYCRKYHQETKSFSESAIKALNDYDWPGNIRALRHAIERAVILSTSELFEISDFSIGMTIQHPVTNGSGERPPDAAADLNLDKLEKMAIKQALNRNGYNISHAAKNLGLTRAALYRRMEKHGL